MPVWIFVQKLKAAVSSKLKIHYSRIPLSVKGPQATWGQNCVSNIPLFHLSLHSQPQQSTEAFSFNQTLHRESAWSRLNLPVVEVVRPRWSACTSWARPSARCTTFGSSICAVFGATTLNPQFMLASRSPRAQWPSSSTGARTKQTHKQTKNPSSVRRREPTRRHPPGLRRNARRWPRPPGSRSPDGFQPCSQLQHGLLAPGPQPADKPANRTESRATETLMGHEGGSWTHRRSANRDHLGLTAGRAGLIDSSARGRETQLKEGVHCPGAWQHEGDSARPQPTPP